MKTDEAVALGTLRKIMLEGLFDLLTKLLQPLDVGIGEQAALIRRNIKYQDAIATNQVVIEVHQITHRFDLIILAGVPKPTGTVRNSIQPGTKPDNVHLIRTDGPGYPDRLGEVTGRRDGVIRWKWDDAPFGITGIVIASPPYTL